MEETNKQITQVITLLDSIPESMLSAYVSELASLVRAGIIDEGNYIRYAIACRILLLKMDIAYERKRK